MAGGVALNCVANTRLAGRGPVRARSGCSRPPATRHRARRRAARWPRPRGEPAAPMPGADLGRGWTDDELERLAATRPACRTSGPPTSPTRSPRCWPPTGSSAWFQGRSEYGPRALGHRSLLAHPGHAREPRAAQRRQGPRAVPAGRADGAGRRGPPRSSTRPAAQPVHAVRARRRGREWRDRIPAVVHVDGTARIQTVDPADEPLVAAHAARVRAAHRAAGAWSTPASTPPAGRWSTTRGTRWSASAPRRSTCWRSGPFLVRRPAASMTAPAYVGGDPDRRPAVSLRPLLGRAGRAAGPGAGRGRRGRRPAAARTGRSTLPAWPTWLPVRAAAAARGPAAARNVGWRATATPWVAFLDDDVRARAGLGGRPGRGPGRRCAGVGGRVAGPAAGAAAGRTGGRPTGSAAPPGWPTARWITADMAYRRDGAGARSAASTSGSRGPSGRTPTWRCGCWRPAGRLRAGRADGRPSGAAGRPAGSACGRRRGNADDALMRRLHGPDWRRAGRRRPRAGCRGTSRSPRAGGCVALAGLAARRPPAACARLAGGRRLLAGRDRRVRRRRGSRPGPRTAGRGRHDGRDQRRRSRRRRCAHRLRGELAAPAAPAAGPRAGDAVLFDRDGTLVHDVPYNGDPDAGRPGAGRARGAGPAARRRGAGRGGHQPVRGRPRAGQPRPGRRGQRPGRGAARAVRHLAGLPARARGRLRLPQAGARAGAGRRAGARRARRRAAW